MCDLEIVVARMKGALAKREAGARRGRKEEMAKEHERHEQFRECSDMKRVDFGHNARQPFLWRAEDDRKEWEIGFAEFQKRFPLKGLMDHQPRVYKTFEEPKMEQLESWANAEAERGEVWSATSEIGTDAN